MISVRYYQQWPGEVRHLFDVFLIVSIAVLNVRTTISQSRYRASTWLVAATCLPFVHWKQFAPRVLVVFHVAFLEVVIITLHLEETTNPYCFPSSAREAIAGISFFRCRKCCGPSSLVKLLVTIFIARKCYNLTSRIATALQHMYYRTLKGFQALGLWWSTWYRASYIYTPHLDPSPPTIPLRCNDDGVPSVSMKGWQCILDPY